ncbi:hypothetical protein LZ32DRAFT_354376 [Colletotrichum eremochloae]|nr:hypothetical protein LZ32DRAFT_354376 [Colletotrichum eremochloae]
MHPSQSCSRLHGPPCSRPSAPRITRRSSGRPSSCKHFALFYRVYVVACVTDDVRLMIPAGPNVTITISWPHAQKPDKKLLICRCALGGCLLPGLPLFYTWSSNFAHFISLSPASSRS